MTPDQYKYAMEKQAWAPLVIGAAKMIASSAVAEGAIAGVSTLGKKAYNAIAPLGKKIRANAPLKNPVAQRAFRQGQQGLDKLGSRRLENPLIEKYAKDDKGSIQDTLIAHTGATLVPAAAGLPVMVPNFIRGSKESEETIEASANKLQGFMGTKEKLHPKSVISIMSGGGAYVPDNPKSPEAKGVHLVSSDPGVAAHEFGHAKNLGSLSPKKMKAYGALRSFGTKGAGLGSLYTAYKGSKGEDADGVSAALALVNTPMVAEESLASARGSKGLFKYHRAAGTGKAMSALKSLSSFKGVPTYAAAAAVPYISNRMAQKLSDS